MKTTLIIVALIVAATIVMVVFYKPANQLVRRVFQQVTGTVVISEIAYNEMVAKNIILGERADALELEIEGLRKDYQDMAKQVEAGKQQIKAAEAKVKAKADEISEYHKMFEDMADDDLLIAFDNKTEGTIRSVMHDDNRVLTGGNRIRDATAKLHDRQLYVELSERQEVLISEQEKQIKRMENIVSTLQIHNALTIEKKTIYREQYENCLAAKDDVLREANRKALIGYVVGIAGLLWMFIN